MGLVRTPDGRVWDAPGVGADDYYFGSDYAIGQDFAIGADDYYFGQDMYFGAPIPAAQGPARMAKAAMAAQAGGFAARDKSAQWGGRLPLPLGPVAVAASGQATITANPQNAIKTEDFIISSGNAALFDILEIAVGTENQFVQSGTVNGDIFSSGTQRQVGLKGSTANPGNTITVRVQNLDTVNPQTFRGAIIGPVIRSYG